MDKTVVTVAEAIAPIASGASLAVGGFGMCGVPTVLIEALRQAGVGDLEIVSNNCGAQGWGLAALLAERRIRRVIASYFGTNEDFARQYLDGELEVELTPQGTLAERLRAGGAGIAAFFTPTGAGTVVADGGMPWRYAPDGGVAVASPPKETRSFDSDAGPRTYVLERAIKTDFAFVRARRGDRHGNLVFHGTAMNFNPLCAMAGRHTVAEVEELVEPGELHPDEIHLPGVFVHAVLPLTADQAATKQVEFRTVREEEPA